MKKFFVILVAVIGVVVSATLLSSYTTKNESEGSSSTCYCTSCENQPLSQKLEKEYENVDCSYCNRTGKQNCKGWDACSSCGGTGCKNGYTTNNGQNCAYGHCSYCGGKGGRDVMDRWKHCSNCHQCQGKGWYERLARQYYIYYCPRCKREFSGC